MSAIELIETAAEDRVLFAGDSIIDEYQYVKALGKSPKEHIIPLHYERKEVFQGGVVAAAAHAKTLCGEVCIYSRGPITRKVRFVEDTYLRKVGEVHYDEGVSALGVRSFDFDTIVITDFGHGAISDEDLYAFCESDAYLAVNAQTNSANLGFNLITKYPRADFIVIDEPEARLAARERKAPIEDVMMDLARRTRCKKIIVTLGAHGAIGWESGYGFRAAEAITNTVIDTMGAGDAFFAVTALFAKKGSLDDLLAIGNAAGAAKTQIIGHRRAVSKAEILQRLRDAGSC
jgi:bifunctional ADP-heptose synthase (sugar kinase/adenylyltransferase)